MDEAEYNSRIAAAKARTDAAAAKRAELLADRAVSARLADQEREAALNEAIVDAESKIGELGKKIAIVHATYADGTIAGSVIVKVASGPQWAAYKAQIGNAKGTEIDATTERLWRPNIVYPELAVVDRLCAELPFFTTALGDAVGRLCGVRVEDIAAKP